MTAILMSRDGLVKVCRTGPMVQATPPLAEVDVTGVIMILLGAKNHNSDENPTSRSHPSQNAIKLYLTRSSCREWGHVAE
ncbi:hypothetical protein M8J75_015243 [Diaphorina citri]|nr:hypothetical protein M8J75_015243 [Diaphorina citri]